MKRLALLFTFVCEASEHEVMRARSINDLEDLWDRRGGQERLVELCRLEKKQMVVPVACLSVEEIHGKTAEILCSRVKPVFFLEVEKSQRQDWPEKCKEVYVRAEERRDYRRSF